MLARHLQPVWPERSKGSSGALAAPHNAAILKALRSFEKERKQRVLPISVRAHAMGSALQIAFPPVRPLATLIIPGPYIYLHYVFTTTTV